MTRLIPFTECPCIITAYRLVLPWMSMASVIRGGKDPSLHMFLIWYLSVNRCQSLAQMSMIWICPVLRRSRSASRWRLSEGSKLFIWAVYFAYLTNSWKIFSHPPAPSLFLFVLQLTISILCNQYGYWGRVLTNQFTGAWTHYTGTMQSMLKYSVTSYTSHIVELTYGISSTTDEQRQNL